MCLPISVSRSFANLPFEFGHLVIGILFGFRVFGFQISKRLLWKTLTRATTVLRHKLIHPKINEVLGRAGHHAKILIADGNYPSSSKKGPHAELVCLNLAPGVVTCTQVLEAILSAVPVDGVNTMMYT